MRKNKKITKKDVLEVLAKTCELLLDKICKLEKELNGKADKPEEVVPEPKKEKPLGEGVIRIDKPPMTTNQVGDKIHNTKTDKFIHQSGTTTIEPKIDEKVV